MSLEKLKIEDNPKCLKCKMELTDSGTYYYCEDCDKFFDINLKVI